MPISAITTINPTSAIPTSKKMAKSAPKKDPKNDFIYLEDSGFFDPYPCGNTGIRSLLSDPIGGTVPVSSSLKSTLEQPGTFRKCGKLAL
jgi:hypothetical protein